MDPMGQPAACGQRAARRPAHLSCATDDEPTRDAVLYRHRPRRRRIRQIARAISAFSCIIVSASAADEAPSGECSGPRVVRKFTFHPPHPNGQTPRVAPQLGDGIRSAEATGVFFDSLDTDGDGTIEPDEVAVFLRDEIGGKQFDTQSEVDEEVGTIMERLDHNHNNELEMSDLIDYWMQLEKLLSPEEVAEWIVYSVQLPSGVGKIFLENGITGYDFLEIVDNGGRLLQQELGIEKESFRNKIVRQMQARMLGIGSSPGTPQKFTHKLESCKAVTLSWEGSTARVFPVHSYRIQRRATNLFGSDSLDEVNASALSANMSSNNFDPYPNSDWRTVYVGGDSEYIDSGLELGHNYQYRIQAWNSVGRSGWESTDLSRALKKQRCSTKPSQRKVAAERGMPAGEEAHASLPKRVVWGVVGFVQFLYHSVRFIFALFALLAGVMRYRRATATSSSSQFLATLPFPNFWKSVNRLSMKVFGYECIPRTMLGDRQAILRQEQLHDDQINATGLRGYDRTRRKTAMSVKAKDGQPSSGTKTDRRSAMKKGKSHSTGDLTSSTVTFDLPKEVVVPRESATPNKFSFLRNRRNGTQSFFEDILERSEKSDTSSQSPTPVKSRRSRGSRLSSMSTSDHPRRSFGSSSSHGDDDDNVCSECQKKFRIGKRYKHHCSRCMATFCHKHGRTTHTNFTSCKVPGDCMCNSCLREVSERSEPSSPGSNVISWSEGFKMAPTASNEEAELLARLQSQFGDLNVGAMMDGSDNGQLVGQVNSAQGDGYGNDSESSVDEPTEEELLAWQEAQFQKGRMKLEAKKIREGGCEDNIFKSALQRRRQAKSVHERLLMREHEKGEAEEWEHLPSAPDLGGAASVFFPNESDGELVGGVNPLLRKLVNADPDVLGTKWRRLFSSADGDGLSFRNLLDKLIGYDGPTVFLIGGTPSASKSVGTRTGSERVSIGFFTTDTWIESPEHFGSSDDCFLFSLDHATNDVQIIRPRSTQAVGTKQFLYCHPSGLVMPNMRRKVAQTNGSVHGIGIGGTASQPRLHISESLEECRALEFDALFQDGDLLSGKCQESLFYFDVDCIELFGVGGEDWIKHALQARELAREMKIASLEKARKVDKRQFMEDFENGLTSGIKPGLFGHRDLVEERCDA
ncbi:hypothetical protein ACHAXT_006877 [Thalassiosira profunda]